MQIASRLSAMARKDKSIFSINLYDQGESILRAWDSKTCGAYRANNGFHGIELPRALGIKTFLEECKCNDLLTEIPNIRSLNIEGEHIAFDASLPVWPNWLSEGLASLRYVNSTDVSQEEIINRTLSSTMLGQLISTTYDRFADTLDECWNLFFPWFFPSDFKFSSGDEGNDFRNEIRLNQKKSSYLMPHSFVFEDLKHSIQRSLQMNNVNFIFNKQVDLAVLDELSSSGNELIWCASSFSLLQLLNSDLARRCISSKRHMHLIALSITARKLRKLRNSHGNLPSEILCLDTIAPELNRLSFVNYSAANYSDSDEQCILLAECFTKSTQINDDLYKRLVSCLRRFFASDLSIEGYSYARPTYSLNTQLLTEATSLIQSYSAQYSINIPEIYYGPINMAKCGIIAQSLTL